MVFIGYGNCWLRAYAFYRLSLMQQHDASKHLLPINPELQYQFSDVWNFICWVSFAFQHFNDTTTICKRPAHVYFTWQSFIAILPILAHTLLPQQHLNQNSFVILL